MDSFTRLLATFDSAFADFEDSPAMRCMRGPDFRPRHYAAALREIYFYTRENPQLQASMTLAFRGAQREAAKRVLGHAMAEVGHDQLALEDLARLGVDVRSIPNEEPLPSTIPLTAYPLYLFHHGSAVAYLGQIFFLEFMPTRSGPAYLELLSRVGVPSESMTFLAEHAEVDVQHNRLMERHAADLLTDARDLEAACTALRVASHNYAAMLESAFAAADRFSEVDRRCAQEVFADAR